MAKHKPINRIVIAGLGIGVLIAVIAPVMIFVFGVGNDNILPQSNPDQLEIPFVTPEQEQNNEQILQEIIEVIGEPEKVVMPDPVLVQAVSDCQALIFSSSQPNSVNVVTNQTIAECTSLEEQLQQEIQELTQEVVENLESEVVLPEENPIPTESSTSDPFEQLCDQNPSLIICSDTTSLELITKVLKTDSAGTQTTVETKRTIPQLSFFVEDTSNIDFRNGLLQFELIMKGDPNFEYNGVGEVDLLIGQQSLFTDSIQVKVGGKADQDGKVKIQFISPTGQTSDSLLFRFADNINKFTDGQTTPIRLHVNQLDILGERDQSFSLTDVDAFSMDIARDETKLLITDSQGVVSRVYPSDSRIILSAITGLSEPATAYTYRVLTYDSLFRGNGLGCSVFTIISDVSYPAPTTGTRYPVPPPTISGVSVMDSNNKVLTSVAGGSGKVLDYTTLTRDQNYTLKVTSPSITSTDLVYGKSQETKSYTCQQSATVNLISGSSTSGNQSPCGYYTIAFYFTVNPTTPLKLGAISCDIPK